MAGFGRVMQRLEERWYADTRRRGMLHAASGTALAAAAGWLLTAGISRRPGRHRGRNRTVRQAGASHHLRAAIAAAVATYVAVAARALSEAASHVAAPLEAGDLDLARRRLPALVGRDPAGLGAAEIARAVVESVAENTVDAVVAPRVWAALAGPAGGLAYRALNTLDAMVGHRSPRYARFGWAAARADDVAGWLPARLTALLVAGVRPGAAAAVLARGPGPGPGSPLAQRRGGRGGLRGRPRSAPGRHQRVRRPPRASRHPGLRAAARSRRHRPGGPPQPGRDRGHGRGRPAGLGGEPLALPGPVPDGADRPTARPPRGRRRPAGPGAGSGPGRDARPVRQPQPGGARPEAGRRPAPRRPGPLSRPRSGDSSPGRAPWTSNPAGCC